MTRAARRISAFHLSERLKESGTGDELDQLARTLNETLERLDAGFNQMRQFSADASHELQTPLTVLKGEIEVALRSHRDAGEYKATLESALEEIDRMAKLVEGLLFLARADSGVLKIDSQSIEIQDLVCDVQEELAKIAAEGGVKLNCENTKPVRIVGDPVLLRQLIQNLVHNGLKYTPEGGRVDVQTALVDGRATITVSDTGEGVEPEEKDKIFQRFYRSARAKSQSGGSAGLGLSIVESIVKAHQGQIEVISKKGSGTTFVVSLPISRR
jgi:heavy metal sensor kinase